MKKLILTFALLFCAAAVFAQSEYNYQRRSLFEKLPVTSRDIVFLGNSITDGCEWNELLGNPRIKNRGINGDRTGWMLDRLDPIIAGQPRKLFLLIGTNDLAANIPPEEVLANIRKIVERFQSEAPRTKLYVQSVFPVNDAFKKYAAKHGRHDADIVTVNKGLQALCKEKGIVYIDLWTPLADENGKLDKAYTNDGLHLMGEGYLVWRDVVKPYVK
ncbi:GDSL-type esterase/lipase family protein [uncultured Alistipes sp.]|uniref:GDSL-type esterase/lipase family protein n=1 Tax=uncultured Alistipes sp. TaxID=538949 RepID=UPI00262B27D7|nr:GDSL-type esterase/lipase family protein [uncultured Alistipes sp.]